MYICMCGMCVCTCMYVYIYICYLSRAWLPDQIEAILGVVLFGGFGLGHIWGNFWNYRVVWKGVGRTMNLFLCVWGGGSTM